MTFILDESGDRDLQFQRKKRLTNSANLPLATVCEDQVGQYFLSLFHAFVATCDDLSHRSIVVRAFDGADIELAVILL